MVIEPGLTGAWTRQHAGLIARQNLDLDDTVVRI